MHPRSLGERALGAEARMVNSDDGRGPLRGAIDPSFRDFDGCIDGPSFIRIRRVSHMGSRVLARQVARLIVRSMDRRWFIE